MSDTSSPTPIDASSEYGSFPPGTIVLAKLKSFPPWPAIIIPNDLVPEKILKSKPKKPSSASGGSRRPKRKAAPVSSANDTDLFKVWCVRFLKDDTFMWASINELELLTTEKIQSTLGGWKNTKKKQLKSAYEMALSPPDVEDFIIWGSDGKPIQIDNEADDEDFTIDDADEEEDAEEDEDVAEEEEDVEEDLEDEDESPQPTANTKKRAGKAAPKASASKKRKTAAAAAAATKGSKKSTPVPTPKKPAKGRGSRSKTPAKEQDEEQDPDTSGDEDWEQAIGGFEEEEEEDLIGREIPTSSEYAELLKKNKPLINKVVVQFTTAFLEEEKLNLSAENIKSLNGLLDQLTKVEDTIPKSLVLKNNVHKLFIAVLQRNDLRAKNVLSIRTRLQQFLSYWFDVTVEVNPHWKLEPEEDEEDEEEKNVVVEIKEGTDATHDVKEESSVVVTAVEELKTQ